MSKDPIIILFNGPPGSGKDTAAVQLWSIIQGYGFDAQLMKFADPLKNAVGELFGMNERQLNAAKESAKDKPFDPMMGYVPREEFIRMSEDYAKVHYGNDFFGRVAGNRIISLEDSRFNGNDYPTVYIFSDSGFLEEFYGMSDTIHKDFENTGKQTLLVRLERTSHDFSNDSRSYIKVPPDLDSHELTIVNNGSLDDLNKSLHEEVIEWLRTLHKELDDTLKNNAN